MAWWLVTAIIVLVLGASAIGYAQWKFKRSFRKDVTRSLASLDQSVAMLNESDLSFPAIWNWRASG